MSDSKLTDPQDLGWDLSHPLAKARLRAARALAEHPDGYTAVDALVRALDDENAAVREAVSDALDWVLITTPEVLAKLVQRVRDEQAPASIGLARYLVHLGTTRGDQRGPSDHGGGRSG